MTTPKCTLCGTDLTQFNDMYNEYHKRVGCPKCKWTTYLAAPQTAWDEAKRIISLFPPFMRIQQGDMLTLDYEDGIFAVIGKDVDRGKIYLQTVRGDIEIATLDDVEKWPWELDQEGGPHDA